MFRTVLDWDGLGFSFHVHGKEYAREAGLVDNLASHDLRRTCAKLCRASGGDLEPTSGAAAGYAASLALVQRTSEMAHRQ